MANLLNDEFNTETSFLTPVFPVQPNRKSSLLGDAIAASPKLIIKGTGYSISKEGDTLSVNGTKIDIGYKNILDVVNILRDYGIEVKFLNDTAGWDFPASCILDFTNKEYSETDLTHIPYDLESHRLLKNKSIEPIADLYIKAELVFDTKGNQKAFTCNKNFISGVTDFTNNTRFLYSVLATSFLIKVSDNKFSTTKTDVLAKHIDKVIR